MSELIKGLKCVKCGELKSDLSSDFLCERCGNFTQIEYDLQAITNILSKKELSKRPKTLWKYKELLPLRNDANIITLYEGGTPLIKSKKIGSELGLENLYFKDTTRNPTGSFKDYSASVSVSKAKEIGFDSIVLASGGNASSAFAAYAAIGEITFYSLMLPITNETMISQNMVYNARGFIVNGTSADAGDLANKLARKYGWMNGATPLNPYRAEGKKIIAYEITEQLEWKVPDRIICPTAGGTSIIGMWKAFCEMKKMGWINSVPKLDCIQPNGCAPIVKAWRDKEDLKLWPNPKSIAIGLQAPNPAGGNMVLEIIDKTNSYAETVSDDDLRQTQILLSQKEGLYVEPSSSASLAGVIKMLQNGVINKEEIVVCMLTGTGLKAPDVTSSIVQKPRYIEPSIDEFIKGNTSDF